MNSLDVLLRSTISQLSKLDSMPQPSSRKRLLPLNKPTHRQSNSQLAPPPPTSSLPKDRLISPSWFLGHQPKPSQSEMLDETSIDKSASHRRVSTASFMSSSAPTISVSLKPKSDSRWGYTRNELNYKLAKALRSRRKLSTVKIFKDSK